jgi:CubicO group peptidase (beta-lactamase class C family)
MKSCLTLLLISLALAGPARGAGQLPKSSPKNEGVNPKRLDRVYQLVESHVKSGKLAGAEVMILRHGKIIGARDFGSSDLDSGAPMTRNTILRIYSMTKVVTSIAALQLFEEGKLPLDAPITNWLPELKDVKVCAGGTAEAPQLVNLTNQITVRMLLNHTAGLTYEFYSTSPVHELYKRQDLWESRSLDDFIAKVGRLPLLAQPGRAFNYSISLDVLGVIIQRVSGEKFEDYVANHITQPLKMNDTFFDVPAEKLNRVGKLHQIGPDGKLRTTAPILGAYAEPGKGIPAGGAGLFSTIDDYARFAQMLLNNGELHGTRILSRKTVEMARSNEPSSAGMFYWSGAATTHFFCDPKEQVAALIFCQHIPFDQHGIFTKFRTAVFQALE